MNYYRGIFGGDLRIGTASDYGIEDHAADGAVVHAVLTTPSGLQLFGWDAPAGMDHRAGNNVAVFVSGEEPSLRDSFDLLSRSGDITRPLKAQTWGSEIGSLVDKFGVPWMFSITREPTETREPNTRLATTDVALDAIIKNLARQPFRARFRLSGRERAIVDLRGIETIRDHAVDIIRQRLAPAQPRKDGRQTPYRGHPVFVSQHATATCCRTCLATHHGIRVGHALNDAQTNFVVDLITRWITRQYLPGRPPR